MIPYYVLSTIHIGPLTLNVWGLFAGLAFAAALLLALKEARRKNIKEDYIFDLAVLILLGGVVGARLAYVLENWSYFSQNQAEILSFKDGGLMFFGGATGVILLVAVYLNKVNSKLTRSGREKLSFLKIVDTLVPSFAVGEFIGRIGCSLADLHIGTRTVLPWAQEYIDGTTRHPVSIYMSLNGLAMLIIFWFLRMKIKTEGALFLIFVLWYSGTRFFWDFLRCNDLAVCDPRYFGWTPSQYFSLGSFIISLIFLILIIRRPASTRSNRGEQTDKKHMAEQQNNNNGNKNSQESIVSYTEIEEVIFENNTGDAADAVRLDSGAKLKSKISAIVKKPWMVSVVFIVALAGGVIGSAFYYNSVFYGKMFKNPPFVFQGKTWIFSNEPIVGLKIVNDKNCKKCDTTDIVSKIKAGVIPTLSAQEINFDSEEGKKLIETFKINSLPALVFDSSIEKAAIFAQVKNSLNKKDNLYYLSSAVSGIPPAKFLEVPKVSAEDRFLGSESAPITIIEFSDFQCPFCKTENDVVKQILAAYPDKVKLVFKHLPLSTHTEAQAAAEAAECAGDQGKFFEIVDTFFANQTKLDAASIAGYARNLKLDAKKFKECIDGGKFKSKIENDIKTAQEFGVTGTPAFFVGDEFLSGAMPFEQFKEIIDAKLAK